VSSDSPLLSPGSSRQVAMMHRMTAVFWSHLCAWMCWCHSVNLLPKGISLQSSPVYITRCVHQCVKQRISKYNNKWTSTVCCHTFLHRYKLDVTYIHHELHESYFRKLICAVFPKRIPFPPSLTLPDLPTDGGKSGHSSFHWPKATNHSSFCSLSRLGV